MASTKQPPIDPSKIRAAVFDLGGVLIDGGPGEVIAFGDRVGLEPGAWQEMRREIFGNQGTWAKLERGEVSLAEFAAELRRRVLQAGGNASESDTLSFMGTPDPMSARNLIRDEMLDAVSLFDVVIDSSAIGSRKPEPKIYEHTRERLGIPHEEIFFIDDIGQNLKAARALGWQTLLFTNIAEVLPVLHDIHESQ